MDHTESTPRRSARIQKRCEREEAAQQSPGSGGAAVVTAAGSTSPKRKFAQVVSEVKRAPNLAPWQTQSPLSAALAAADAARASLQQQPQPLPPPSPARASRAPVRSAVKPFGVMAAAPAALPAAATQSSVVAKSSRTTEVRAAEKTTAGSASSSTASTSAPSSSSPSPLEEDGDASIIDVEMIGAEASPPASAEADVASESSVAVPPVRFAPSKIEPTDSSICMRLDLNEEAPLPRLASQAAVQSGSSSGSSGNGYGCSKQGWNAISRSLAQDHWAGLEHSPVFSVWQRWATQTEKFASEFVSKAYAQLRCRLQEMAHQTVRHVPTVLAVAGADVADHDATMAQVEQHLRSDSDGSRVALVGPEDFKSLAIVVKRIVAQLMVEDKPKEDDTAAASKASMVSRLPGMADFVEWYMVRGIRSSIVLLMKQADNIPKEALHDLMGLLGKTCLSAGIPIFVVLGLQHPPQVRPDLLEGHPRVGVPHVDTVRFFDADAVSARLFQHLATDATCPLALDPKVLLDLRSDYTNGRQSVSHLLQLLALVCLQGSNEEDARLLPLLAPLDGSCAGTESAAAEKFEGKKLQQAFETRLQKAHPSGGMTAAERKEAAAAASEAMVWRHRLCLTLDLWDVILCAVHRLGRQQPMLWRHNRLLDPLWPRAEVDAAAQRENIDSVLSLALQHLRDSTEADLRKMLTELCAVAAANGFEKVDEELAGHLTELLDRKNVAPAEFQAAVCKWFEGLAGRYWQPLEGKPREIFLSTFHCGETPKSKAKLTMETVVRPLLHGRYLASQADADALKSANAADGETVEEDRLSDIALLGRLLEATAGRSVEIGDLWRHFSEHVSFRAPCDDKAALQKRFGHGLFALYFMSVIEPTQCAAAGKTEKEQRQISGWRLRKRHYGRECLKRKELEPDENYFSCLPADPSKQHYENVVEALARPSETKVGFAAMIEEQLAPWMRRGGVMKDSELEAFERRAAAGVLPAEPKTPARAPKKQRVRMFMA
eukprot:TRINITY_DN110692_c0_g1_i1.p1 TRINITY_DN110692_c0_g1~~TRINITY_DN110692_c0_g1_i1.p1  ORF type:complete len:1002 (+),score=261.16 TRINITY_DN110692_c0_g1_i1:91-3096(+)